MPYFNLHWSGCDIIDRSHTVKIAILNCYFNLFDMTKITFILTIDMYEDYKS
jgi:hypothetical protein